jgi:hypothetical protein
MLDSSSMWHSFLLDLFGISVRLVAPLFLPSAAGDAYDGLILAGAHQVGHLKPVQGLLEVLVSCCH